MLQFGKSSASATLTGTDRFSSRMRSAALIPASLPPMMRTCIVPALRECP